MNSVIDDSLVALALLVLRRRQPQADAFRLPAGKVLAVVAILFCVVLLLRSPLSNSSVVVVTAALAATNWAVVRSRLPVS